MRFPPPVPPCLALPGPSASGPHCRRDTRLNALAASARLRRESRALELWVRCSTPRDCAASQSRALVGRRAGRDGIGTGLDERTDGRTRRRCARAHAKLQTKAIKIKRKKIASGERRASNEETKSKSKIRPAQQERSDAVYSVRCTVQDIIEPIVPAPNALLPNVQGSRSRDRRIQ